MLFKTDQVENEFFLRLSINAHRKQSFFAFQGLHCLEANLRNDGVHFCTETFRHVYCR